MRRQVLSFGLLVLAAAPAGLTAQGIDRIVGAARFESYSFDPGLPFTDVSEFTVPVGADVNLGRRLNVAISTGFARISITRSDASTTSVSGVLDSEVRFAFNIVPGNLIAVATGVIPTGIKSLELTEVDVLGALSSDVIGFAAPNIGSGGSLGAGLVGAVPVGRFAIGLGATYKYSLPYEPVVGQANELQIGSELRTRVGLEGPLGPRTYLRLAGVYAVRAKDEISNQTQNGVGNRIIGYAAVNHGVGNAQVTVYAFDVFRSAPRLEGTAVGLAEIPKGNLLAAGARVDLRFGRTSITPRGEYRVSSSAALADADGPTGKLGSAIRFGLDLRRQVSPTVALVVQGDGLFGQARLDTSAGTFTDFNGYRAGLFLEFSP